MSNLYTDKFQRPLSQSPRAAGLDRDGVAGADGIAHRAFARRGFEDEDVAGLELLPRFGEVADAAPHHRRVFAQAAAVHQRLAGLIPSRADLFLIEGDDLAERDAGL